MKRKLAKKQLVTLIIGLVMMLAGASVLGFYGIRKIVREIHKQKLLSENTVLEIPALKIKAPVLEGVELSVLKEGAGHFPDTGAVGAGNYCVAAHSSVLYKEYFNALKNAEAGMEVRLTPVNGETVLYTVSDMFIVEPSETWILKDFGDDRITMTTCTDDGNQRRIVVAQRKEQAAKPAVLEIPELNVSVPLIQGVAKSVLTDDTSVNLSAPGAGAAEEAGYCVSAGSKAQYTEYFNALKNVRQDMTVRLTRPDGKTASYTVSETILAELPVTAEQSEQAAPAESAGTKRTWNVSDLGDCRFTMAAGIDDGSMRIIIICKEA